MDSKGIYKVYTLCLLFTLISCQYVFSQSFGLGFYGYDVHQDKRTGLDLSPGKPLYLKNDFELSFDISLRPYQKTYYGYVVRIINDDHTNVDLIYNVDPLIKKHFKLIIGDTYSQIPFDISKPKLIAQWNNIRIRFNADKGNIVLSCGKESFSQHINLSEKRSYKILFGANRYPGIQTTDVPPMIIRNIKIIENNKLTHNWPLDEYNGNTGYDNTGTSNAYVTNPSWIKKKHSDWELTKSLILTGEHTVAFDDQNETLYIIGRDTVFKYFVPKDSLVFNVCADRQFIIQGAQSVYIPYNNKLFDINIDRKQVASFNFNKSKWDKILNDSLAYSGFYQHNKFFSSIDTSLYIIGGYGYHLFKNKVQRYHFSSARWESIKTGGDFLAPHYLAALGGVDSGAYILGGYGSIRGEQSISPRYFYSLTYFDVKTRGFKKIYDLKLPWQDFVFANSMIINKAANSYYALMFDKDNFNSKLQLISGSLTKPEFEKVGSTIPYNFQDISSFADLFYCKASKRFIAVTLNRNENNKTKINVYSIYTPPIAYVKSVSVVSGFNYWFILYLAISAIIIIAIIKRYKRVPSFSQQPVLVKKQVVNSLPFEINPPSLSAPGKLHNTILMFGDMQVFDADGNDLTLYFTPLIKELFLALVIYSIRWGRGISSKKLEELLWSGKSSSNAHNNRAVNMVRLRSILEKMDNCIISKENGYWKINVDHISIDYKKYLNIIANREKLNKQTIAELTQIVCRGCFLSDVEFEWLDVFKSEINNEVIDIYLSFAASESIDSDPEFFVQLANYIFNFDPVNEDAMVIKCKALSHLGKHSLAKTTFESFSKEYEIIYGERFHKNFHDIMDNLHKV